MNAKKVAQVLAPLCFVAGAVVPAEASWESRQIGSYIPQLVVVHDPLKTQTTIFRGTVWKNDDQWVLRDEAEKVWYQLDDQRSSSKFEGKQVRVIGTLDAASRMIHVQKIEEDA